MRKYFPYIAIGAIVLVLVSVYLLFKTTTTVVELPIQETQLNDAVTVTKGVTEIGRSFQEVRNLIWKGEVAYFIGEAADHSLGFYKFDGARGGLYALKSLPEDQFDMKNDRILSVLAGDGLLIHRKSDGKICIRTASGRIVILVQALEKPRGKEDLVVPETGIVSKNMDSATDDFVSVSEDGRKVALLTHDGQNVVTYDMGRNARKQIHLNKRVEVGEGHDLTFSVSPSGEYFVLADSLPNEWKFSHISIIGIDTGRYYVSDVAGVYPVWSPAEDKISFLYTGELAANTLDKVRLGVLDCATRKITYYDNGKTGVWFARHTAWTGDGKMLVYLSYKKDGAGVPKFSLSRFDLVGLAKKNFNIPVTLDPVQTSIALSGISIALDDKANKMVHMVDAENNTIKTYVGVDSYEQGTMGSTSRLTASKNGFLGYDAQKLVNMSARGIGTAFDLTGYTGKCIVNGAGNGAALLDQTKNGQYKLKFVPLEKAIQ